MNFSRSPDGQPQQSFQHAAAGTNSSPSFGNPSPHGATPGDQQTGQAAASQPQQQSANDPQVVTDRTEESFLTNILSLR